MYKTTTTRALTFVLILGSLAHAGERGHPSERREPGAAAKSMKAPAVREAARMHLVLTGFTTQNPHDIGPACYKDVLAMRDQFEACFRGSGNGSRLIVHNLSQFESADAVYRYLREMQVASDEVVVFYHSGHGGSMVKGREADSHRLMINGFGQSLERGQVRNILSGHNPHGLVMLTDCCSAYVGQRSFTPRLAPRNLHWETVRRLFLVQARNVDITAAQLGVLASANHVSANSTGAKSAFTVALLMALQSNQTVASWNDFFVKLSDNTWTESSHGHRPHAFSMQQHGVPQVASTQASTTAAPAAPVAVVEQGASVQDQLNRVRDTSRVR